MPVDVVTGDRDLFQVVDDERQVRVLYIARGVGKHEMVDDAWVRAKYGIPAAAYVDYATLRGDASDGLPGVAGIGEKTAASLLNSYGRPGGDPGRGQPPGRQDQRRGHRQAGGGDRLPGGRADRGGGGPRPRPRGRLGRPGAAAGPGQPRAVRRAHRASSAWAPVPTGSWRRWPGMAEPTTAHRVAAASGGRAGRTGCRCPRTLAGGGDRRAARPTSRARCGATGSAAAC